MDHFKPFVLQIGALVWPLMQTGNHKAGTIVVPG
jgi:hypothetical protein